MATPSPKFSMNWKEFLEGLAVTLCTQVFMPIFTSIQAGQFSIDWTKQAQLAASVIAGYCLKTWLSGPNPPTSGSNQIGSSGGLKVILIILFCGICASSHAQSIFKPLPLMPKIVPGRAHAVLLPTDSLPNISNGKFHGFRFVGPDIVFAIPDFSGYTGLGIDYVVATADPVSGKWDYDWTIGPRVYGGADLGVPTVKAIGAVGARATFFNGWLALAFIYNLTTKKPQAGIGNPAALIPGLN